MLVQLGSGRLEIDALTGQCEFEGKPIAQLPIALELVDWARQDLEKHGLPATLLTRARLSTRLSLSQIPWKTRTKETFYKGGSVVRTEKMHRCIFECASEVAIEEAVYRSEQIETQEWPVGWPTE